MTAMFEAAFAAVIGNEGGYVNDPRDPGGATKYGISQRSYPRETIATLTLERAQSIYYADYWTPLRCDDMPPPLALLVFDAGVNCGVKRAARWVQAAVGVRQDGEIGDVTVRAIAAHHGKGALVAAELMAQRTVYMAALSSWPTYGLGWSRRLAALPWTAIGMGQTANDK